MKDKLMGQHKRMAMGEDVGFARGGTVGSKMPTVDVKASGKATNPLRAAKAANGIPGFKAGGKKC